MITMGGGAEDMGTGWRGAFGSYMIMRSTLLKSDWSKVIIWNGVMERKPIRKKYGTGSGTGASLVQNRFMTKVWHNIIICYVSDIFT